MSGLRVSRRSFRHPAAVHQWFGGPSAANKLQVSTHEAFHMSASVACGDGFTLLDTNWPTPGHVNNGSNDLMVSLTDGTGTRFAHGSIAIDSRLPLLVPAEDLSIDWEDRRVNTVVLDLPAVEQIARVASGDPDLHLRRTGYTAKDRDSAIHWIATQADVRRMVSASPHVFGHPLVAQQVFHRLATAFLHAFPTNWLECSETRGEGAAAVVRRALEFMHAHAAQPISVTDIAAAAFVSTRWLHRAFVKELGEPPNHVLRRIRLAGVRSDLLTGAPSTTSVAHVARSWGFAHLSRFAQQYRLEYGERPSETLHR